MNTTFIHVLQIEVILLALTFVGGVICGVVLDYLKRRRVRDLAYLSKLFMRLVRDRIDDFDTFLAPRYCKLDLIIPTLEAVEKQLNSTFWLHFKQRILTDILHKQIEAAFTSTDWGKVNYAIRAVTLSPSVKYQHHVLPYLVHTNTVLCFAAIRCAIQFQTLEAIERVVHALNEVDIHMQYAYRDALIQNGRIAFRLLKTLFLTSQDPKIKQTAFSILGLKAGYLDEEEIIYYCKSKKEKERWIALRTVENYPSDTTIELVLKGCDDTSWKIRALSAFLIGSLHIEKGVDKLAQLISEEDIWVQFIAALALHYLKEEGRTILDQHQDNHIVEQVRKMPKTTFTKGLKHFFPINQDPDILFRNLHVSINQCPLSPSNDDSATINA